MFEDLFSSHDLIGTRSSRSLAEVILKTLAIITTTTIAAGHLTSLRSISKKDRGYAILSVFLFVVNPVMPLASLICNFWKSTKNVRDGGDWIFFLSAVLGVHATLIGVEEDADRTVLLCRTGYRNVQMVGKVYDWKWIGRMIVILLFEIQAVMTAFLVVRRIVAKEDGCSFRAASIADYLDGVFALGGIFTGLTSLGISLSNYRWETFSLPPSEFEQGDIKESTPMPLLNAVRHVPMPLMNELGVAQWIFHLLGFSAMWLLFPDVASIWSGYYLLILGLIIITWRGIIMLIPSLVKKGIRRLLWAKKYLDVFRAAQNIYAIYYASATMFIVFIGYTFEAIRLREYQDRGWWMEIMWVDPLAEKLHIF